MSSVDSNLKTQSHAYPDKGSPLAMSRHRAAYWEPHQVVPGRDLPKLLAEHKRYTEAWRTSREYPDYVAILRDLILNRQNIKLETAMCLGLGAISTDEGLEDDKSHPMSQLVAFESWIQLLRQKHSIEKIYFQEPRFTSLDEQFLTHLGYEVIQAPRSDDLMSDRTFLFSPGAEQYVEDASIAAAHPNLHIGADLTAQNAYLCTPQFQRQDHAPLDFSDKDAMLPFIDINSRAARRSFLDCRAFVVAPDYNVPYGSWKKNVFVYYKPDSELEMRPVVFQYEGEEFSRGRVEQKIFGMEQEQRNASASG